MHLAGRVDGLGDPGLEFDELVQENDELRRYLDRVLKALDQRVQPAPAPSDPTTPSREQARATADAWRRTGQMMSTPSPRGRMDDRRMDDRRMDEQGDHDGRHGGRLRMVPSVDTPPQQLPEFLMDPLLREMAATREALEAQQQHGLRAPAVHRQQRIRKATRREGTALINAVESAHVLDLERRLHRSEQTLSELVGLVRALARVVAR